MARIVLSLWFIFPSRKAFAKYAAAAQQTAAINGFTVVERKSGTTFECLISRYMPAAQMIA